MAKTEALMGFNERQQFMKFGLKEQDSVNKITSVGSSRMHPVLGNLFFPILICQRLFRFVVIVLEKWSLGGLTSNAMMITLILISGFRLH